MVAAEKNKVNSFGRYFKKYGSKKGEGREVIPFYYFSFGRKKRERMQRFQFQKRELISPWNWKSSWKNSKVVGKRVKSTRDYKYEDVRIMCGQICAWRYFMVSRNALDACQPAVSHNKQICNATEYWSAVRLKSAVRLARIEIVREQGRRDETGHTLVVTWGYLQKKVALALLLNRLVLKEIAFFFLLEGGACTLVFPKLR